MTARATKRGRRTIKAGFAAAVASFAVAVAATPALSQPNAPEAIPRAGAPGWPPAALAPDCHEIAEIIESWKEDDIAVRDDATAAARRLLAKERARIRQQVMDELGPLAFARFSLDIEPEGELRTRVLENESCIFRALRAALASPDPEVRARAEDVLRVPDPH